MKIVNNRICFASHNVVLDPSVHDARPEYIWQVAQALTPNARPSLHKMQLNSFSSINTFAIELPQIDIKPMYASEYQERHPTMHLPEQMLATVYLHDGKQLMVIFVGHCRRRESFQPLWNAMYQRGIHIGKAQRRVAEARYFANYDAAVKLYNPPLTDTTL